MFLFADDTKLYRIIDGLRDIESLQRDVRAMEAWARIWHLLYHQNKCKFMTVSGGGQQQSDGTYTMGLDQEEETVLSRTDA